MLKREHYNRKEMTILNHWPLQSVLREGEGKNPHRLSYASVRLSAETQTCVIIAPFRNRALGICKRWYCSGLPSNKGSVTTNKPEPKAFCGNE